MRQPPIAQGIITENFINYIGDDWVTRTPDLHITNALLYRLSYVGTWKGGQYIQNLFSTLPR